MDTNTVQNGKTNVGKLVGRIADDPVFSHSYRNEKFYSLMLEIKRFSGVSDNVPLILGEKLSADVLTLKKGDIISCEGEFRSRIEEEGERHRHTLYFFAKNFQLKNDVEEKDNSNQIKLFGFICKVPSFRTTPFNREVCDLMLAVKRHVRTDYIPCIAWGRNARFVSGLKVGTGVDIEGRIQSRVYEKETPQGKQERMVNEVSISEIAVLEEKPECSAKEKETSTEV